MARRNDDDDDDDSFGPDGLLRDGRRARVPMMFRDSADGLTDLQRSIRDAASPLRVVDGFGNSGLALQRPGPRFSTDAAANDAREQAYLDMVRDLDYRTAPKPPAALPSRDQKPGDICTINGAPGHLNHRLECVPDRAGGSQNNPPVDAADAQRIKDQAYDEMVAAMDYRTASRPPR